MTQHNCVKNHLRSRLDRNIHSHSTMILRGITLVLFLLAHRCTLAAAASGRQINGTASAGNHIHVETEVDLSSAGYRSKININSDVPVTIQRTSGGDGGGSETSFLMGQQPVPENMAKVLVTSDCDTTETQVVPNVTISPSGDITVVLDYVKEEDAKPMPYLEPSSYSALWTWMSDFCGIGNPFGPIDTLPGEELVSIKPGTTGEKCSDGQCLDPNGECAERVQCFAPPCSTETCDGCVENYCGGCHADCPIADPIVTITEPPGIPIDVLPITETQESCDAGLPCAEAGSSCERGEESCCGATHSSFKCECVAQGDGSLEYDLCSNTNSCLFPPCCESGPPAGKPPPAAGTCFMGLLCDTGIEDDYCCQDDDGTYCSKTGGGAVDPPVDAIPGVCECEVGPDAGSTCGDGKFCQTDAGACNLQNQMTVDVQCGTCATIPDFCTEEYSPVCACDGRTTYSNACYARLASASVAYKGECQGTAPTIPIGPVFIGGPGDADRCELGPDANPAVTCGAGEFCQLDTGVCNDKSGVHVGLCAATPDMCFTLEDPVCGCDQKTYSNECVAHSEGVSVSRVGDCDATPKDPAGATTLSCPESLEGVISPEASSVLHYAVVPSDPPGAKNGLLCARLEVKGESWVGFGISPDGRMIGSDAIIGLPDDDGSVLKYDLISKSSRGVAAMDVDNQTLIDASLVQVGGMTIMEFSKMLVEDGEVPILEVGVNHFLFAKGSTNTLGYHPTRLAFTKDFSEDAPLETEPPIDVAPIPGTAAGSCDPNEPCVEEGSTCARGTETCCGVTHDSSRCTCGRNGNGPLQYSCFYTDACLVPPCCIPGPPADKPPPADRTCNMGQLCNTGIDDDWCCRDEFGGAGTYCSKSGGTASETTSATLPTAELGNGPICNPCEGISDGFVQIPNTNCAEFAQCTGGVMSQSIACQDGLIFDAKVNLCNWKESAECGQDPACPTSKTTSATVAAPESADAEPTAGPISSLPQSSSPTGSPSKEATAMPSKSPIGASTPSPTGSPNKEATEMPSKSPTRDPSSSPTGSPNKEATEMPSKSPTRAPSSSPTGSPNKGATEVPPKSPTGASMSSPTGSPNRESTSTVATSVAGTTAEMSSRGTAATSTTTTVATTVTSATEATNSATVTTAVSTTNTDASFAVGDFPTEAPTTTPSKAPTPPPNDWWDDVEDSERGTGPNSAFSRLHSLSLCMATAFVATAVISLVFPGVGGNNNLWGYGKFAVAAMAVSSLYPKKPHVRRGNDKGPKSLPAQNERALETCTFNVEVLISGCTHPLEISAPAGRVVDGVIDNLVIEQSENDPCVTDYEATLNFPVTGKTTNVNGTVETFPQWAPQCLQPVMGRPFIDATGGSLQAMANLIPDNEVESADFELSWTGEAPLETQTSPTNNATGHARVLLGEDWTRRALGEHASIASFSAFSIALMSNGAPAALVDGALKAGLDEVRHARTSFDIASKLTGREVGPGRLPESKLEFSHDLKALALAVAIEGCLDETLSAFAAAVEVEHITEVLDNEMQGTPYSDIGRDLLNLIRNELVTIAMDESNHSALAWRTLNWACSVDSKVCDDVNESAFEEGNLDMRFNQRADSAFGERHSVLHLMREEWKKVFKAHQLAISNNSGVENETTCKDEDTAHIGKFGSGHPLLASVTENILRQAKLG